MSYSVKHHILKHAVALIHLINFLHFQISVNVLFIFYKHNIGLFFYTYTAMTDLHKTAIKIYSCIKFLFY